MHRCTSTNLNEYGKGIQPWFGVHQCYKTLVRSIGISFCKTCLFAAFVSTSAGCWSVLAWVTWMIPFWARSLTWCGLKSMSSSCVQAWMLQSWDCSEAITKDESCWNHWTRSKRLCIIELPTETSNPNNVISRWWKCNVFCFGRGKCDNWLSSTFPAYWSSV